MKKKIKESKEYIDSDKKEKDKIMKKISELSKEQQKYIKEKEITEQKLNEKEIKINDLEKKLNEKEIKINDLEEKLNNLKKYIDFKNRESDTIKKLSEESKEPRIKKLNIMRDINTSDIIKSHKDLSTPTKIPQSVRKRDDKVRTFAPLDNVIRQSFLKDNYENINLNDINKLINLINDEITEYDNIADIDNNKKIILKILLIF